MEKKYDQFRLSVYLPIDQANEILEEAEKTGMGISEVLREKTEYFFNPQKKLSKKVGRPKKEATKKITFYLSPGLAKKVEEYAAKGRTFSEIYAEKILKKS